MFTQRLWTYSWFLSAWRQESCQSIHGKESNWIYLFEKVTQVFSCKLKSNVLLEKVIWLRNLLTPTLISVCEKRPINSISSRGLIWNNTTNANMIIWHFQVMILITGSHKAFALYKAIEEGVNHMWTVSAFQQHPQTVFVCDEDATQELKVKTVKYFKGNTACLSLSLSLSLLREWSEYRDIVCVRKLHHQSVNVFFRHYERAQQDGGRAIDWYW